MFDVSIYILPCPLQCQRENNVPTIHDGCH